MIMKKYSRYSLGLMVETQNIVDSIRKIVNNLDNIFLIEVNRFICKLLNKTFTESELFKLFPSPEFMGYRIIKAHLDSVNLNNFIKRDVNNSRSFSEIAVFDTHVWLQLKEEFIKDVNDEILNSYKDQAILVYNINLIDERKFNKSTICNFDSRGKVWLHGVGHLDITDFDILEPNLDRLLNK